MIRAIKIFTFLGKDSTHDSSSFPAIIVLGIQGSGKSYFINKLTCDTNVVDISDDINHRQLQPSKTPVNAPSLKQYPNIPEPLYIVEVPGLDDYTRSDEDILSELQTWLETEKCVLKGAIYLYDISRDRYPVSTKRAVDDFFRKWIGQDARGKVVLGITKSDIVTDETLKNKRLEALRTNFWKGIMKRYEIREIIDTSSPKASADIVKILLRS
ncbi:hypothetical protein JR316_0000039 [Psilocybe cubensis]|uniref:Uncharacterized protein n=2 Tax=Psilocybe cubensis TaxID=181762 RepID=A0ACB8HE97_PSICU|nr:hypothetical protein JR316_0000039 [Psilocybe cubensis]KAH9485977.1 hypothetical protein JR316_0000039 [Psilocybe cubensis]